MTPDFSIFWQFFFFWIQQAIKRWTRPSTALQIMGALSALPLNRVDLIVENTLFRQQLIALNQKVPIIVVSKRLGHVSPSTTLNVYSHLYMESQDEPARIMDSILAPELISFHKAQKAKNSEFTRCISFFVCVTCTIK